MGRQRRTIELETIRTKDRAAAAERMFLKGDSNDSLLFKDIGNAGTGVGRTIGCCDRRVGKWIPGIHRRYAETVITDEYMSTQLCLYCYIPIAHRRILNGSISFGIVRCLNSNCEAFKHDWTINNRDAMSATVIGLVEENPFPHFSRQQ